MLKETDIQAQVFAKIRNGEISMRPKFYFVARVVFIVSVAVAALLFAILVLSFTFFAVQASGQHFLLEFGHRGLLTFILLFPWIPILCTCAAMFLLDYLLRYFKFGYRVPVIEIFFGVFAVVVLAGVAVNFTPLHASLLDSADRDSLPIIGPWYENIHDPHQDRGIFRGVIASIQGNQFVIGHDDQDKDTDDGTSTVEVPASFAIDSLRVGECVFVAGVLQGGVVHAYGIREMPLDDE